jgi:hypothetical protein
MLFLSDGQSDEGWNLPKSHAIKELENFGKKRKH